MPCTVYAIINDMKIAISTAVYYPMTNGVAVFSFNLASGLARRGHEVMVLCPSQTGKSHVEIQDGVKVVYLKSKQIHLYSDQLHPIPPKKKLFGKELPHVYYKNGFPVSALPAHQIKKALDKFKPEIIHCQGADPVGVAAVNYARKNHIPLVTTEHNMPDVFTGPLKLPKPVKKPVDFLLATYFVSRQKHSDYITMPTQLAIDDLITKREKKFEAPVEAVSNGVDLSAFKAGPADPKVLKKYHLPNEYMLYVGRVDPEKQLSLVIKAFAKALKEVPNARFVIVGDGVDKANLEKLVKKLRLGNSIIFLGRVLPPDVYDIYRAGLFFATASEIETQGIVLIEAAATGLPLIAVDKGAVSEICRDGENGFLCQPKDIDAMAAGIVKLFSDKALRKKFSDKSIALVQKHDIANTLTRFEEIYTEVIANKD